MTPGSSTLVVKIWSGFNILLVCSHQHGFKPNMPALLPIHNAERRNCARGCAQGKAGVSQYWRYLYTTRASSTWRHGWLDHTDWTTWSCSTQQSTERQLKRWSRACPRTDGRNALLEAVLNLKLCKSNCTIDLLTHSIINIIQNLSWGLPTAYKKQKLVTVWCLQTHHKLVSCANAPLHLTVKQLKTMPWRRSAF